MNLADILTPYFFNIHFNIILPSTPMSAKWLGSAIKILYQFLVSPIRTTCHARLILGDFMTACFALTNYKNYNLICWVLRKG
jgi:hypothetical protein